MGASDEDDGRPAGGSLWMEGAIPVAAPLAGDVEADVAVVGAGCIFLLISRSRAGVRAGVVRESAMPPSSRRAARSRAGG